MFNYFLLYLLYIYLYLHGYLLGHLLITPHQSVSNKQYFPLLQSSLQITQFKTELLRACLHLLYCPQVSITKTHLKINRDIYETGGYATTAAASSTNTRVDQNSPPDGTIEIETDLEILEICNEVVRWRVVSCEDIMSNLKTFFQIKQTKI